MIAWIAEGLEKVVPHPDLKSKESPPAEPPAEVQQLLQDLVGVLTEQIYDSYSVIICPEKS